MCRRKLWVEIVGARNLESRQSLDAYCVVQVVGARTGRTNAIAAASGNGGREKDINKDAPLLVSRTASVQSIGSSAAWSHAIEFELDDAAETSPSSSSYDGDGAIAGDTRVIVQIYNEKNFFFDMFPSSGSSNSSSGRKNSMSCSESRNAIDEARASERAPVYETDSDDDDEHDHSRKLEQKHQWVHQAAGNATAELSSAAVTTPQSPSTGGSELLDETDEPLGFLELNLSLFYKSSRIATDAWYVLRGTRSGEVRLRTLFMDEHGNSSAMDNATSSTEIAEAREAIFQEQIYGCELRDHYGFKISDHARQEWTHLRSYEDCREERRLSDWELAFGNHFFAVNRCDSAKENSVVRQLARAGVPRSWRERVYMSISGTDLCVHLHHIHLFILACFLNAMKND